MAGSHPSSKKDQKITKPLPILKESTLTSGRGPEESQPGEPPPGGGQDPGEDIDRAPHTQDE